MNWKTLKIDWAKKTDAEIAAKVGLTRQNVSAARKRLGKPASPAGHGGYRHGQNDGKSAMRQLRPIVKSLSDEQRHRLVAYAQKLASSFSK